MVNPSLARFVAARPKRRWGAVANQIATRTLSSLTAEEAGRRAAALAASKSEQDPYRQHQETLQMSTILSHAGIEVAGDNTPLAPPLHTATTFTRPADGIYKEGHSIYARYDNPTRILLEENLFQVECINVLKQMTTEDRETMEKSSFAFSSGLMGATSIILAHSSPLTVMLPHDLYHGVSSLLLDVFHRHHVQVLQVDMRNIDLLVKAFGEIAPGREIIVWMESPSNPKCHVLDIQSICQAVTSVSSHKVTTVVDGTMSSPILTRPLELGADVSFHSGTKYLAGHSDALLGAVTVSPVTTRGRELTPLLRTVQVLGGGVASPWDCWLTLRGLRTLQVRVERQCKTALTLAEYLSSGNPKTKMIKAVHYPGLASHPQHDIAKRQMQGGYGGIISIELEDEVAATALAAALKTIQRATSLGGTETLIEHRSSIEPPTRTTSPPGLLRISVGLEDVNDLVDDFDSALAIAEEVVQTVN